MIALSWLLLAVAVIAVPVPTAGATRIADLAARGRVSTTPAVSAAAPARRRVPGWWIVLAGSAGVVLLGAWAGPVLAATAAVAGAALASLSRSAARRRRDAADQRQLLAAVRVLVAELAAGARPADALESMAVVAASRSRGLREAALAASRGEDVDAALAGTADLEPLAHAWRVADRSGAPLSAVVARVGDDLAIRAEQARSVSTALAAARSSASVVAALPLLGIALGSAMGADPVPFLLGPPAGRLLCLVGVLLDAVGLAWTQRLTSRASRA
jgi:tight adherence protein B